MDNVWINAPMGIFLILVILIIVIVSFALKNAFHANKNQLTVYPVNKLVRISYMSGMVNAWKRVRLAIIIII